MQSKEADTFPERQTPQGVTFKTNFGIYVDVFSMLEKKAVQEERIKMHAVKE